MTNYEVIEPLWDGSRWHQPGQPYPPEGVEVAPEIIKRYHGQFIATPDEIAQKANPEAHGARTELQTAQARVAELEAQVASQAGVESATPLLELLKAKDGALPTTEQAAEVLKTLSRRAQVLEDLNTPLGTVTPLPQNFVGRAKLAVYGLDTFEALRGKTAEQLDALGELTEEQRVKIADQVEAHFVAEQPAPEPDADLAALLAAFADEDGKPASAAEALEAVKVLRQDAARADQYAKLSTVEGGTELAPNFVGRGKFAALGLTTYESLRGKSAKQLDAVEGVTPEQAAKAAELVDAHFAKTE